MEKHFNDLAELFGSPIHIYTRAKAIEDGSLVDVRRVASEAGFTIPVAVTANVWADCVTWSESDSTRQIYQDESGRLWDVLWMAGQAARKGQCSRLAFQLYRVPRGGRGKSPRLVTLSMVIGPGDDGEPVITIMLPGED